MFNGDTFWTYEDAISVGAKIEFAREQSMAGAMLWELSGDTDSATLLKAARHGLDTPTDVHAADPTVAERTFDHKDGPTN